MITEVCPVNAGHRCLYYAAHNVFACLECNTWLDAKCVHAGCRWCARRTKTPGDLADMNAPMLQKVEQRGGNAARAVFNQKAYGRLRCGTCGAHPEHQVPSERASCGHVFTGFVRDAVVATGRAKDIDVITRKP